jgi:hypothetical protein
VKKEFRGLKTSALNLIEISRIPDIFRQQTGKSKMENIVLKVTYVIEAHNEDEFEEVLQNEVIPLAEKLGIELGSLYKTVIGTAGEFVELWLFDNLTDYEKKWSLLINHPKIKEIFKRTGPMVKNEKFQLLRQIR